MLSSYFKIALRSLLANRLYSGINILGLAVGLASCILMFLFVSYELSYDTLFTKTDRVARIQMHQVSSAGMDEWPRTGAGWKNLLETTYPEIIQAGRIFRTRTQMKVGDIAISERVSYADSEIFDIFNFEFIQGSPQSAFKDVHSIVLTQSSAKNLFGDKDPMGETISFFNSMDMKVTGIIEDLPENTHLANSSIANLLAAAEFIGNEQFLTNMTNMNFYTYLEFADPKNIEQVAAKLPELIEKNFGALLKRVNIQLSATLIPLQDIHLYSRLDGDLKAPGDIDQVYLFSAVAALILLIACINFMNLATARASQRAKEVGVRKAIGVSRQQIIIQFLSESVILSCFSLLIAVALVELSLPFFAEFVNRGMTFDYIANPTILITLLGLALLVGLFAGSYPAFYLSAFTPAKVLKGDVTRGRSGIRFRQFLVVFQFCIASVLIISTITVYQQMLYAKNMKLGFDKEQILIINGTSSDIVQNNYSSFEREMKGISGVKWMSSARRMPSGRLTNNTGIKAPGQESLIMPYNTVDHDFFQNFGIELVSGRYFNREFANDTLIFPTQDNPVTQANVILNRAAARKFGWDAQTAVGKVLEFDGSGDNSAKVMVTIVGVVKNYHFESARDEFKPIVHFVNQARFFEAALKIESNRISATMAEVESVWKKLFPTQNINYEFMDDNFDALYIDEERISVVYTVFSVLAICIACLGLFGLASYTTERRTKEIGVRKVLGASSQSIVVLLTKEFSKLVIVASIFAWPLAWLLMNDWLQSFAFRIELSMMVFILGTLLALMVAWGTVAGQATKAAITRPVKALRYE